MWSISKSENNFYVKKFRHCSCKQSRMYQGKYTFLYAILKLYKSQFEGNNICYNYMRYSTYTSLNLITI